jgi:hypothetical protein
MTDGKNAPAVSAADIKEIRALFLRQAAGETAHDIQVIDSVLARTPPGQPDPVDFVLAPTASGSLTTFARSLLTLGDSNQTEAPSA